MYPLKALLKQPATAEVVALLAETYSDCGDKLNAMAYVHWALSLDEKSFEGLALVIDLYKDQNQLVQAIHYCTLLIRHHPGYLKARLRLGDLHEKNDQLDKALEQYLFVRTKEPLNAALWTLTGRLRTDLHQLEQAQTDCEQGIQLNPHNYYAIHQLGLIKSEQGQYLEAEQYLKLALKLKPDRAEPLYNLASCRMALGDFQQGFDLYKNRWRVKNHHSQIIQIEAPKWNEQLVDNLNLLLWTEQGLGDGVYFARALAAFLSIALFKNRTVKLVFAVDSRLKNIFTHSFPDVQIIPYTQGSIRNFVYEHKGELWQQLPIGDLLGWVWQYHQMPLLQQAAAFAEQHQLQIFKPYLRWDEEKRHEINRRHRQMLKPDAVFRIGLSWHSVGKRYGQNRSLKLDYFVPLMKAHPQVQWVSIQYGDHTKDIERCQKKLPDTIDFIDDSAIDNFRDIDEFSALIAGLDLVISIDNSTIHLSGAMGIPTWLLLPSFHNWRWPLEGDDPIWYQNMSIKRWQHNNIKAEMEQWSRELSAFLAEREAPLQPAQSQQSRAK